MDYKKKYLKYKIKYINALKQIGGNDDSESIKNVRKTFIKTWNNFKDVLTTLKETKEADEANEANEAKKHKKQTETISRNPPNTPSDTPVPSVPPS